MIPIPDSAFDIAAEVGMGAVVTVESLDDLFHNGRHDDVACVRVSVSAVAVVDDDSSASDIKSTLIQGMLQQLYREQGEPGRADLRVCDPLRERLAAKRK
ncbi:MAG: hypothetical protein WC322_05005 [Candidatus Paceibacterota bacterium]|jgi:hypothetical protein